MNKVKYLIKYFDNLFFGNILTKTSRLARDFLYKNWLRKNLKNIESDLSFKYYSYYSKCDNLISQLCDKHGSDKGEIISLGHPYRWPSHTYADYYFRMFSHCRFHVRKVFECGVGTNNPNLISSMGVNGKPGASLRVWRDFFPNATIYGADIDEEILFQEQRIITNYMNQLDPDSINKYWANLNESEFDFMIDDGLHTFEAGSTLFINSIKHLSKDGIYIIEDVLPNDLLMYKNFFSKLNYFVDYVVMFRPNVVLGDNSLVVVRNLN